MGCDICYTNHAEADQDDMDTLSVLLANAGLNFLIGVPGADDIMLNYQSTSFHDALFLRELTGLKRAPEFEAWLQRQRITDAAGKLLDVGAGQLLMQGLQTLADETGNLKAAP
jgi:ethanolamine ammonia-lyase large subunit